MIYKKRGKMVGKSNKLKIKKLQINFTNKWLYTLIVFFSLIVIGVGVYAVAGATPNPGHPFTDIQPCSAGQILKSGGTEWACGTDETGPEGTTPIWSLSGSNIYYNSGNVGIGTETPIEKLDVAGNIQAAAYAWISSVPSGTDTILGYNAKGHASDSSKLMAISPAPTVKPQAIVLGPIKGIRFITMDSNPGEGADIVMDSYEKMRITPAGNVGIGTISPGYKLEVNGDALISGNLHVGGFAAYSGAFIGYYDGTCDIGHTGVIRYTEDYCNGYVYLAGLQVCTKTGTNTASWKFANSHSYGSCYTPPNGGNPGTCFPAGTKVIMFDNSLKNIEDIKEGDYVLSYDEESGEYVSSKVEKLLVHTEENTEKWPKGLYNIFTSDGSNRKITGNHPVYTKTDVGWKYNNVENLVLGDAVKIYNNGEPKEVYIISIDFIEEDLKVVYNLRLTKPNTYFAEGLLVHNLKALPSI